jgi:TolB-like protein
VAARPTTAGKEERIRSLAVLPLENLSGDPEQEYFADGMTEAVISEFARLDSLNVISRTSVMQYKKARKPLPEIARELGVEGVVEGTVIRAGDRVRITVQLIDARSDHHLWADSYDRDLTDVLALHSEVARAVADHVRLELTPREQAALSPSRSVDPAAYDVYLRGRKLQGSMFHALRYAEAIEQLERAVELDPSFAEAWVALAAARCGLAGMELRYRDELQRGREAAERALEIDPRLGIAHLILSGVREDYDWDLPGAYRAREKARELSPGDPYVLLGHAWNLFWEGRTEEALAASERAVLLAPRDRGLRERRIQQLFYFREYERGLEEIERARELFPDFVSVFVADIYNMLGRYGEAWRAQLAWLKHGGAPLDDLRQAVERGYAEGGSEGATRAWLEVMTRAAGFSPTVIGLVYARIGEVDEALSWFERAYEERDNEFMNVLYHPYIDVVRSDPRIQDLLRRALPASGYSPSDPRAQRFLTGIS